MGPNRARVVEMLSSETAFEFAMRAPSDIRESVTQRGFLSQHEVSSSRGTLAPSLRAISEASFLGIDTEQYNAVPNAMRPKYGYLRPSKATGLTLKAENTTKYGDDVFIFKRDAVILESVARRAPGVNNFS